VLLSAACRRVPGDGQHPATLERVELLRTIHHAAAIPLIRRRTTWVPPGCPSPAFARGDASDLGMCEAVAMLATLFLTPERPAGKFNFEQKFTYCSCFSDSAS
jgi:hypothetical protein